MDTFNGLRVGLDAFVPWEDFVVSMSMCISTSISVSLAGCDCECCLL